MHPSCDGLAQTSILARAADPRGGPVADAVSRADHRSKERADEGAQATALHHLGERLDPAGPVLELPEQPG